MKILDILVNLKAFKMVLELIVTLDVRSITSLIHTIGISLSWNLYEPYLIFQYMI